MAVYATRLSDRYDLLHSAFAIPVAGVFGLLAVRLARRVRRRDAIRLGRSDSRAGRVGRLLGVVGLCMAASALVALAVYGLLEYVGTQD